MKKGLVLSNEWEHIGALLADETDEEQAKFFRGFITEMETWDTGWARGMQIAAVSKLLTKEEKELLSGLTYIEEDE